MADPLEPFLQSLWRVAVPVGIAAVVIGTVLGLLARGAESWLVRFIRSLRQPRATQTPDKPASDGDVPHCPSCNNLMVLRHARRGASAGQSFWGCSTYPTCKGTRPTTELANDRNA